MENNLAEELYSESLQLSKLRLDRASTNSFDEVDFQNEDGSLWGDSDEEINKASELDREWHRRRDQFHTVGYRDGLIAGKEASAQEGFNIGFKQSVMVGYNLGLVRGVTSALASLPDGLRQSLIEKKENRNKFQELYESVRSLSTTDALKLFHDDIMTKKVVEQSEPAEAGVSMADSQEQSTDNGRLQDYFEKLQYLLSESPEIKVHLAVDK